MDRLSAASQLVIVQKKEWGEILAGFEGKNRYAVLDLRRDFPQLLACIKAVAMLYQRQREIDDGHIVATLDDYAVARDLNRTGFVGGLFP